MIRSFPVFTTVDGAKTDIASGEFVTCPPGVAFAETLSRFGGLLEYRDSARDFYAAGGRGVPSHSFLRARSIHSLDFRSLTRQTEGKTTWLFTFLFLTIRRFGGESVSRGLKHTHTHTHEYVDE